MHKKELHEEELNLEKEENRQFKAGWIPSHFPVQKKGDIQVLGFGKWKWKNSDDAICEQE